jgi:hypothetical protein
MPEIRLDMYVDFQVKLFLYHFNQNQNMPKQRIKNSLIGYEISLKSV